MNNGCCGGNCCHEKNELVISDEERGFLLKLAQTPYLPLARFVLKSSKSDHLSSVALAPVYINEQEDSADTVKHLAEILNSLEHKGLITLDYDEPLSNCSYQEFSESRLYEYFAETVAQGKEKEGFLFDIPDLEFGSIALTDLGQSLIKKTDAISFA